MIAEIDKKIMLSTARSRGAVGKNAILPNWLAGTPGLRDHLILDFGCGKDAIHVKMLREQGFEFVFGVDLEPLTNPDYEYPNGHNLPWHLVYASNVLNVQPSYSSLQCTVCKVAEYANKGVAYFSYPKSPRKLKIPDDEMLEYIAPFFNSAHKFRLRGTTIFKCRGKNCQVNLEKRLTVDA